jgi:phosphate transport system permease protein
LLLIATLLTGVPEGPSDRFSALPVQIYNWINRPQSGFKVNAAAAIMVLLGVLLSVNAVAIFIRNRRSVRW